MAIFTVQEFDVEEDERSTPNYDSISEKLGLDDDPPAGLLVHSAGFTGKGQFRIANIWDSEQSWASFRDGRLAEVVKPLLDSGEGNPPSVEYSYELHNLLIP
jgi:hypothetical protein